MGQVAFSMEYEVILALIVGSFLGFYYLKTRQNTPKYLKQRNFDIDELLKLQKKQTNLWKGRYNSRNAGPTMEKIEGDLDLESLIPKLAQDYLPNAPTWLKPILNNQGIIKSIIQAAKDHPDQAKSLLGKFIGTKVSDTSETEPVSGL